MKKRTVLKDLTAKIASALKGGTVTGGWDLKGNVKAG